ncbi:MAG: pantoate--beta-alanine ligase [Deltaproteobacteria bacterium]|jgi:pantoate--beta-alanine ligase|nr:pantoate--beta-alanine ligase [Deltaproteobacteria bacterium]
MESVSSIREMKARCRAWRRQGLSVGLVPTMGFLHRGHGSLVERSVRENARTAVSIFVNPTQFGPGEDLEAYPRDPARDSAYLKSLGANLLFMPEPSEMYPPGFAAVAEVPALSGGLCGASRPGHFRGVCTVVLKLLHISSPDRAYFGMKDAQQFFVLRRMARDFDMDASLVPCETVREEDGLAMSSRNSYLTPEERAAAPLLRTALLAAEDYLKGGGRDAVKACAIVRETLAPEPRFALDYAEAVSTAELQPVGAVEAEILLAAAARLGKARLIDNVVFDPAGTSKKARGQDRSQDRGQDRGQRRC